MSTQPPVARPSIAQIEQRAIAAGKILLGRELVIPTDADLTPPGRRSVRVVRHSLSGRRTDRQIRLYVAGKAFRSLKFTQENEALATAWVSA